MRGTTQQILQWSDQWGHHITHQASSGGKHPPTHSNPREEPKPDPSPRQVPWVQTGLRSELLRFPSGHGGVRFHSPWQQISFIPGPHSSYQAVYFTEGRKGSRMISYTPSTASPAADQYGRNSKLWQQQSKGYRNLPLDPHEMAPNLFQKWSSPQE